MYNIDIKMLQWNHRLAYYNTSRSCYAAYSISLHSTYQLDVIITAVATSGPTIWTSTYELEPTHCKRVLVEPSCWAQTVHTQCCHSVMKKNPAFTLKKKTENDKNTQTYKMFKISQNQTWNVRYRHLHVKIKVICIICVIFLTSSGLFLNIPTIYE